MISAYCHMFGMTGIVFRPANIVGPGQTHGVGYDFMRRLKDDPTRLKILGDGSQTKSYVHIDDVLDAVFHAITEDNCQDFCEPSKLFQVYNLASDDAISVQTIAELACIQRGTPANFEYTDGDRGWKGDIPRIRLNCDRLKALGWSPKYTSAQAMRAALESMK
jgi:UDP-glucose 4-epimerase